MRTCFAAVVMACLLACSSAQGGVLGQFEMTSTGISTLNGLNVLYEGPVVSQPPAFGFSTMFADLTIDAGMTELDGTFHFTGPNGDLFADVEGVIFYDPGSDFFSSSGLFVITGGTGIFAGLFGSGAFSALINNVDGATTVLLGGTLVPAPGAAALLGVIGLVGYGRRRRVA